MTMASGIQGDRIAAQRRNTGFSLVEMMVALVVGLFLMAGVIQVYQSNVQTNRTIESLSRMQENARFSMDLLAREIRMAGFMPCRDNGKTTNVVNAVSGGPASAFGGEGVLGVEHDDDGGQSMPAFGSATGDRISGTDAFWVQGGGDQSLQVNNHQPNASSASFFLKGLNTLTDGDIVLVCDTRQASVFQVTNTNTTNVTVVHNTGSTVSPGNCTKQLGYSSDPCSSPVPYTYGSDAELVKFESTGFYIGVGANGGPALYRRQLQRSGSSVNYVNQELIEGVENMQVQYGLDTDDDGTPERYRNAEDITTEWDSVVAVRFGLLMRAASETTTAADSSSYYLAGATVGAPSGGLTLTHSGERRLRLVFNSTVKIRNKGL